MKKTVLKTQRSLYLTLIGHRRIFCANNLHANSINVVLFGTMNEKYLETWKRSQCMTIGDVIAKVIF